MWPPVHDYPPQAIIFDFGGVVVHWDPRRVYRRFLESDEAIDAFFREVGFHRWNADQDRGGRTWDEAVEELSSRYPHRRELCGLLHDALNTWRTHSCVPRRDSLDAWSAVATA